MYVRFAVFMLKDDHPNRFMHYEWAMTHGGINLNDYHFVYRGEIEVSPFASETAMLEAVYRLLNTRHPADYHARSLSVSDMVKLDDIGTFFCDSVGFKQIG